MNIIESIEQKYDGLTRKQKLIADYMRSHAEDMCFLTLKELSAATDVSEMTVLKLCGIQVAARVGDNLDVSHCFVLLFRLNQNT